MAINIIQSAQPSTPVPETPQIAENSLAWVLNYFNSDSEYDPFKAPLVAFYKALDEMLNDWMRANAVQFTVKYVTYLDLWERHSDSDRLCIKVPIPRNMSTVGKKVPKMIRRTTSVRNMWNHEDGSQGVKDPYFYWNKGNIEFLQFSPTAIELLKQELPAILLHCLSVTQADVLKNKKTEISFRSWSKEALNTIAEQIRGLEKERQAYDSEYEEIRARELFLYNAASVLRNTSHEDFENSLQVVNQDRRITDIALRLPDLIFTTVPVYVNHRDETYWFGRYRVKLNIIENKLVIVNLDKNKQKGNNIHPHIGSYICRGTLDFSLAIAIARMNVAEIVDVICAYLWTYNEFSPIVKIQNFYTKEQKEALYGKDSPAANKSADKAA